MPSYVTLYARKLVEDVIGAVYEKIVKTNKQPH
jgi:hypothetical protein